jgi:hypothetical protein
VLLHVEPAHGGLELGGVTRALVTHESPITLSLDARERDGIRIACICARRVQRHRLRDVLGTESHAIEDERHDALIRLPRVGAPGDPLVLAADRSTGLANRGLERRAGVTVTVAPGVADEPLAAGRALQHRQHVRVAARRPSRSSAGSSRAPILDGGVQRRVDRRREAGGRAVAQAPGNQRIGQQRAGRRLVLQTGFDPNILDGGRGRAIDATRPRISVVDAATGALTVLMEGTVLADARFLWTQASNDQTAVLLHPAYFPDTALRAGDGKFSIDALNLDTGAVTSRALEVAVSGWPPPGTAGPLE